MINGKCIGCGACVNICPQNCLEMLYSQEGFLVPKLNLNTCIDCGRCEQVCPINKEIIAPYMMKEAYFFINKIEYDRNLSSSGGFFKALADEIIKRGGVVFGAAFTSDFIVEHKMVDNIDDMYQLMGSKYVQSNTKNTYREVKKYIKEDKWILYSGTPCQIAGLFEYLGEKKYEKLITLDVFCHGVPSLMVWKKYLEDYHNSEAIRYVQFRYKGKGWWQMGLRIQLEHSEYYQPIRNGKDEYIRTFLKDISLNEECYDCKFRSKNKFSDFFIGDAWNINKVKTNMDDDRGITTVIVNSEKGLQLMKIIAESHHCFKISLEEGAYQRKELFSKKEIPYQRKDFFSNLDKGFKYSVDNNNL